MTHIFSYRSDIEIESPTTLTSNKQNNYPGKGEGVTVIVYEVHLVYYTCLELLLQSQLFIYLSP